MGYSFRADYEAIIHVVAFFRKEATIPLKLALWLAAVLIKPISLEYKGIRLNAIIFSPLNLLHPSVH